MSDAQKPLSSSRYASNSESESDSVAHRVEPLVSDKRN